MDSSLAPSIAAAAIARILVTNPSSSSSNNFSPYSAYAFSSSRAMATAVVIVFIVLLLALMFRIYAKWFMNHSSGDTHRGSNMSAAAAASASAAGLDKMAIDSLPVFTVTAGKGAVFSKRDLQDGLAAAMASSSSSSSSALDDCAVCLSEFAEGEAGRLLPRCHHSFHTECIDMWFHTHSTCPLCRTPVVVETEAGIGSAPSSSAHEIAVTASGSMAMAMQRSGQEQSRVTPISTSEEEEEEQQQQTASSSSSSSSSSSRPPSQPVSAASASHVAIDVQ